MRKYTLSVTALRIIQISSLLVSLLITALSLIYLSPWKILMITLIALCWSLAVIFGGILLPVFFRQAVIYISTSEISLHSGVIFRRRQHMRSESVQYCALLRLPLSGLTGFNFVTLHALGATVVLPFLSKKDALDIIEIMDSRIKGE